MKCATAVAVLLLTASAGAAQDLPRGTIVDPVECAANPQQHYALYLPTSFTPDRKWPVLFIYDPGARGRRGVEQYREAAEKYGFIVAGSNNSRNGPWEPIFAAAGAMRHDVEARFPIDGRRRYAAGMSGGAHVAMALALRDKDIAGVLASSSGFPDDGFVESVPFAVFGTMGDEDFDYDEVHRLEGLKSAHRIELFDGGHQWPPVDVATDGIEWMEIRGMRSGLRPHDDRAIDAIFARRLARAGSARDALHRMRELKSMADDFKGLKDVATVDREARLLERGQEVRQQLADEQAEEQHERQIVDRVYAVLDEAAARNATALPGLRDAISSLIHEANAPEPTPARSFARRFLAGIAAEVRDIAKEDDPQLLALIEQVRGRRVPD